jgi:hypothetical protein
MPYKTLGNKKRTWFLLSILLTAASFSSISSARANGADPISPDATSMTSCAFDGQQNRSINIRPNSSELQIDFAKEGGNSVFLKEYQNDQFIFGIGPFTPNFTFINSWDNLFGAYGAATVRDDFYSFWISDGAAVPIGNQPLCSISVIIQAATSAAVLRQTHNLSFDQSFYGSDQISDPTGEISSILKEINRKYGNLLR